MDADMSCEAAAREAEAMQVRATCDAKQATATLGLSCVVGARTLSPRRR
jgi:hypothetical protein